jgi:large subunit ribosomal protein L10e
MAKKRKGVAYRGLERPYTRVSKYRKLNYARANPVSKIVQYRMGKSNREMPSEVALYIVNGVQIRDMAVESARQTCNRRLEKKLGKEGYRLYIKTYPHHILRENPLASGAGADRMSTGMKKSFGKSIGRAVRAVPGTEIMRVVTDEKSISVAKEALKLASHKLPASCKIKVVD